MASSAETQRAQLDHQNHDFPPQPNGPQNPRRAGLILKGVVITVAIALLPFYPSIPPEFTKRTILTRGWEFLQLVFVGILLCYGLFSRRRSDAADKEFNADAVIVESPQNYVAKILHVSPVFDVDMETVSPELLDSGRKVLQSWSSLYSPTDPVVVRRDDESLLFSVRNLKSNGVSDDHEVEDQSGGCYGHDMHEFCGSCSVSTKESGRQSGEFSFNRNSCENLKGDHAVLPSPVPWRSRSGKMEEENSTSNTGAEEPESLPALRSPIPWNSRPNSSNTPSPNSHPLSPATSTSASRPVSQTPPKPSSISKSATAAADSSQLEIGSAQKQKSTRRELKQMAESMDDDRASTGNSGTRMRSKSFSASSMANKEFTLSERESSASEDRIDRRFMSKPESKHSHSESVDSSATASKSVRTIRRSETSNTCRESDISVSVPGEQKLRKNKAGSVNSQQEIRKNVAAAAEYVIVELPKQKQQIRDPAPIVEAKEKDVDSDAYDAENSSSRRSKSDHSSVPQPPPLMIMKRSLIQPPPPPPVELYEEYMSHWMKEKQKTYHIETHDDEDEEIDDYSDHDEEDDQFEEAPPALTPPLLPLAAEIDANEVDKKADEFIAKFREQIRLQRIESIKRATSSQNRKNKAIRTAGNVT